MANNTVGKNKTAGNGRYAYKYADIAQIHEYLESIGYRYYQYTDRIDGDDYIVTVKVDKDGNESKPLRGCRVVDATLVGVDNPAQEQGSAITYARRYSLLLAFGLATEDNDAQSFSRPKDQSGGDRKASPKQVEVIKNAFTGERLERLCQYYKVEKVEDLTITNASEVIGKLRKQDEFK